MNGTIIVTRKDDQTHIATFGEEQLLEESTYPIEVFIVDLKDKYPDNEIKVWLPGQEQTTVQDGKETVTDDSNLTPKPKEVPTPVTEYFPKRHKNSILGVKRCPKRLKSVIRSKQGYRAYIGLTALKLCTGLATGLVIGKSTLGVVGIAIGTTLAVDIISMPYQLTLYNAIDNKYLDR